MSGRCLGESRDTLAGMPDQDQDIPPAVHGALLADSGSTFGSWRRLCPPLPLHCCCCFIRQCTSNCTFLEFPQQIHCLPSISK